MQSGLVKIICQMGIFMICTQAIVHFRPKASYEKYLKMLVSAMILMQLLLAIGGMFSSESEQRLKERAKWFQESLEESMRRAADSAFFPEESLQFQVTGEEPCQENQEQIKEILGQITVEITPIEPVTVNVAQ